MSRSRPPIRSSICDASGARRRTSGGSSRPGARPSSTWRVVRSGFEGAEVGADPRRERLRGLVKRSAGPRPPGERHAGDGNARRHARRLLSRGCARSGASGSGSSSDRWTCAIPSACRSPVPCFLCINHPTNSSTPCWSVRPPAQGHYWPRRALPQRAGRSLHAACGAIPVYRRQDDPDKMDETPPRSRRATRPSRRAADRDLPEGTTHAEVRVQRIKTGAARLASRLGGSASRRAPLIPVGLNFDARNRFGARAGLVRRPDAATP